MQEDRIGRSQKGTYKRRHEHEHQKFAKRATVLTFTTALLAGERLKPSRKKIPKTLQRNVRRLSYHTP